MKKSLYFAFLLLTLLTTEEMRAQDMINETGYKCNDGGFNNPGLHFVSIIGYDCEGNYLYIDPQQSKLCKCTREESEMYPTASGRNCIFAIY